MKYNKLKNVLIGTLILLIWGGSGCDDFLEEEPRNFISPVTFYANSGNVESALAGIYANQNIQIWGNWSQYSITKMNCDQNENKFPWNLTQPGFIDNSADDGDIVKVWNRFYEGVKRANDFLANVEPLGSEVISEDLKSRMIGEARFLRAISYYYLVCFFGDIPLMTEPYDPSESPLVEKDDADTILDFLISDLMKSVNALPPKSEYSGMDLARVNREAAKMLIAKLAMRKNDWAQAKQYVDEIISSGEYALEEDIAMNYDLETEHGKESIYEINFGADLTPMLGSIHHNHTAPGSARNPLTGEKIGGAKWGGALFSMLFYNSFEDNDERKLKLFWDTAFYDEHAEGRYYTTKYWDFETMDKARAGQGPVNLVYFRYADVLLMKAEIENEINNGPNAAAYNAINQVRQRVNASEIESNLNYEEFLHVVFDERSKEFFYEGHHWFELNRRDFEFVEPRVESPRLALYEAIGYEGNFDFQEYMMLLPIPQAQLDANPKLTQNPGY